ncbi:MAG: DUF92 domain-containing protein [Candidatus Marinimicrobia bacterium]|nr:DUF92 domain-containing protein [Candidatus Neomarinimicrobiota bacterium]
MPLFINFPNEWIAFLCFFVIILSFIGMAEIARKVFALSPELSRKFVHVMVGVLVSFAPFFLKTSLPVILLGLIFAILNYVALKNDSLKGMHTTERVSYGTVYFPIAFLLLVLMFWERNIVIFIVAMLILAFADTAATVIGEGVNSTRTFVLWRDKKSWPGSIAFFITTFIVILIAYPLYASLSSADMLSGKHLLLMALFVGAMTSIAEAVSKRGSDNLSLTLTAALGMDLYIYNMNADTLLILAGWTGFSILLGYGAYKLKSLSVSGGFGAFLLGVFMFGTGGWHTMMPLIGFFVLSSLLSKVADRKSERESISSKGSKRDIVQVYANGGIPLIFAVLWYLNNFQSEWLYWAFLASLAAATADTWETEIGSFSKMDPVNILNGQRVSPGYSGGVSLIGTFGGLLGASIIPLIALLTGSLGMDLIPILLISLSGFLGSVIDSLLGASVQAKFTCSVCGKPTEKLSHCGEVTIHASGYSWLDNDWVNVAGTLSGACIFMLGYYLFF